MDSGAAGSESLLLCPRTSALSLASWAVIGNELLLSPGSAPAYVQASSGTGGVWHGRTQPSTTGSWWDGRVFCELWEKAEVVRDDESSPGGHLTEERFGLGCVLVESASVKGALGFIIRPGDC